MLFSSSIFLFFFLPVVIIGYQLLKKQFQIYFLMVASLIFYGWGEPGYLWVMFLSILVNYTFGLLIHAVADKKSYIGKIFLFIAVACNLGILFYYKYLNFSLSILGSITGRSYSALHIIMPIGISFFTFQGMSYVIDLYRKQVKVQKNPAYIAFYISFFPQLIAGPIVRYIDIEDQIYTRTESADKFASGAKRFIVGLAKKSIIANTMGLVADQVFANPATEISAATAWLGIICYSFQIFFDFSGYSDMAIGMGKLFGFDFLENFNYPYISRTITEFWRRWHMSLSTWFRDYIYIPLGGNRRGNVYVNLSIVFLVTGIWHGASFNFIVWGLWHGLFMIIERVLKIPKRECKPLIPLQHVLTLLIVVIGWVFFRADDMSYAMQYLGVMFGAVQPQNVGYTVQYYLSNRVLIMLPVAVLASTPVVHTKPFQALKRLPVWKYASPVGALALFFAAITFVVASSYNPFIYFRF